ncbi:L-histidine N(alpha)-methyltransferase [Chitinophaga pinensis]|uniref:Methyltransferase n=1 Tax=Chitinophaga pinensis (strain ATCC 43595 / DSM 2588 / LMG 13176 / NBRC 15968 / NCIMB 11800 / UQM 2034) TaxID=485918 RepID=A0A979G6X8_CHIPD|nr:L-histidine N(alpha)-methyltransferase [Chitinophaga pinensis]ACU61891.1 methyltransferase [Chitinophaga pinensis DSM 2588]
MNANVLAWHITTDTATGQFATDVLDGLRQTPKRLHAKYFYDKEGDQLFQEIMASPEYYPTRCELEIFRDKTAELAQGMIMGDAFDLIELGAGDATKSQYLLQYLIDSHTDFTYIPIDISGHILAELQNRLEREIPDLSIHCLEGEYLAMLDKATTLSSHRKVVMFLGANIGNMEPREAVSFCSNLQERLQPGDQVLIGFDLKKHPRTIRNAYDDSAGITAKFNLNLLKRINRELNGNFITEQFEHYQTYDPVTGACKSYLVSLSEQQVTIHNNHFNFGRDEVIYMEVSQKYAIEEMTTLAGKTGFRPVHNTYDSRHWFADVCWEVV